MTTILTAYTLSECMDIMAQYAQGYEQTGEKNLIFCEDRLTLIAERALLSRLGGTFQSSVSTFARFLRSDERSLSKQGSVMAVGEVMARLQREEKLQCFTTTTGIGNNAKYVYETLAQFASSQITPDTLRESLAQLPDDALKKKLSDLALIYEGYTNFLKIGGYVDESRYLSLLPEKILADKTLKEYNVFFLCFSSFTSQARATVRAIAQTARNVIGIFCHDEADLYANHAVIDFQKACESYGKMRILDKGMPLDGAAEHLRKGLFDPEHKEKIQTEQIHTFEAEDKMDEAEYVAVQIRRALAQTPNLRYRDFAVLVPDVLSYALPLKRAFEEYGIPYFLDEKRSLKRHPLSRFLLDCFRVVREKYTPVAVQSLTENPFFGESDEYRNYLLKFANYRGGAKREIKTSEAVTETFSLENLQSGRERLLLATQNIKPHATGKAYCTAVRNVLFDFHAEEKLQALEEQIEDVAHKSYLAQIYSALEQVLAEAELLTGNKDMTVAEFSAILQDGLDATEISLIPLKADAVFLGDISQSRIEKVHTLFAMGMTDAVPNCAVDTAIVSDKEIERLAQVKTLLEPTVAEVNLRTRESVGLNLCTFTNTLFLSYPLSADGSEPALSEVFSYLDALFTTPKNTPIPRIKRLTDEEFVYRCASPVPAVRELLFLREEYEQKRMDSLRKFSSLYTALDKLRLHEKEDLLLERGEQVCVERGEELFFKNGKISPTSLESYFSCPFKNFAERGLRLKDREETAVLAVDTGNFIHEILEITTKRIAELASEQEMRAFALKIGEEILKRPVYTAQSDTASGTFFAEKLLKEGADVAVAVYRQVKNSLFTVEQTEMNVSTPTLHGKIDRVDGTDKYVRVIDYKTGAIDDTAVSYYTGKKLQMQLYMSAIKGERTPAGVFYFPASVEYADEDEGRFRMKGFLNGEEDALYSGDTALTGDKQSDYFPASLKNNRSKRVMDEQTFRDFLDYSLLLARQGGQELKDGFVAPSPYAGACEYCKYGGMCGFNRDASTARNEPPIDPPTIAKIAQETREGKEEK